MDRRIGRRKVLTLGGLGLTVLAGADWRSRRYVLRRDQRLITERANACDEPSKRAASALRVL
jgi:hypothetical protein